jgi:hypothetical protein
MAKKIIILERIEPSDVSFRFVLWATVPTGRAIAYADPTTTSQFKSATPEELAALQAGEVVERADTGTYPSGTTQAEIEADLVVRFNAFQAEIDAANPTVRYGTFFDGMIWTEVGTP